MRFVVVGAGAIGGAVGGRLAQAGHDVVLVARGRHAEVIAAEGLTIADPDGEVVVDVPVAPSVDAVSFRPGDLVLCAVKSQHTAAALDEVRGRAGPEVPVACLQNGVVNERVALRRFEHVYSCAVMCPTVYLQPGVVHAHSGPVTGLLDIGRYPSGIDDVAEAVAAAFRSATFRSDARPDMAPVKYGKLLTNLGNAVEVVCGPAARRGPLGDALLAEGTSVLQAAGITFVPDEDPRRQLIKQRPVRGAKRVGGSTLQSVLRGADGIETDFLNGEIVLVGRLAGVPTPANSTIVALAHEVQAGRFEPGATPVDDVLTAIAVREQT